jgi:catechol 2,3-dioxygenase-like lactoylglutathione lyase family enzyme
MDTETANVRYFVDDVEASVEWYVSRLGFALAAASAAPAFADVVRGPLRLLLSARSSSAGRAMPDGRIR